MFVVGIGEVISYSLGMDKNKILTSKGAGDR